jgi:hypothetical protein
MNIKQLFFAVVALGLTSSTSHAVPIQGIYQDILALCDFHPPTSLTHELGNAAIFPPSEAVLINIASTTQTCCVPDDGFPNEFEVTMTNITPFRWSDLYFVVDPGVGIGNVDGLIEDITAPGFHEAFKIDNLGVNNNLVSGDVNNDLIFDIGEAWTFRITNFVAPANLPPFPTFGSPGVFAFSSLGNPNSNASILANQVVPEPGTVALLALGLPFITTRRRSCNQYLLKGQLS